MYSIFAFCHNSRVPQCFMHVLMIQPNVFIHDLPLNRSLMAKPIDIIVEMFHIAIGANDPDAEPRSIANQHDIPLFHRMDKRPDCAKSVAKLRPRIMVHVAQSLFPFIFAYAVQIANQRPANPNDLVANEFVVPLKKSGTR